MKAFLFDFDGTLANTAPWANHFVDMLAKRYHFKNPSPQEMENLKKIPVYESLGFLGIKHWKVPFILWDIRRNVKKIMDRVDLAHPDIIKVLKDLKQSENVFIGIVSSNSTHNMHIFLKKHNFEIFDHVAQGSYFGKHHQVLKIMKKYHLRPEDTYYVGDETRDIDCARKSGLPCVGVSWGHNTREVLNQLGATHLIDHPEELKKFLI